MIEAGTEGGPDLESKGGACWRPCGTLGDEPIQIYTQGGGDSGVDWRPDKGGLAEQMLFNNPMIEPIEPSGGVELMAPKEEAWQAHGGAAQVVGGHL